MLRVSCFFVVSLGVGGLKNMLHCVVVFCGIEKRRFC